MKDYKELISNLRCCFSGECGGCTLHEDEQRCQERLLEKAADAIEQLAKELHEALEDERHAEEYAWKEKQERDALAKSLDQTLAWYNNETVRADRLEAENRAKEQYIAETIGKLTRERERDDEIIASLQKELVEAAKERDAYAKCFRIMRTDEPFTNHAVFKVDYKDLICHTEEEIANALVYGFAKIINEQRGVQEGAK